MIYCFDCNFVDTDLYAHLVGSDGCNGSSGDFMNDPLLSYKESAVGNFENSGDLGVSVLVAKSLGNLLLNW